VPRFAGFSLITLITLITGGSSSSSSFLIGSVIGKIIKQVGAGPSFEEIQGGASLLKRNAAA
jgi:hypothetical protein